MKKHAAASVLGSTVAMLILILDSRTALEGARSGMELILTTVIPSLFPFFFLSIMLSTSGGSQFSVLRFPGRLCRLPPEADGILIPAFLGGYPAGAQAVCSMWKCNRISREVGERLLIFCNNAGPSFLFGILSALFPHIWMVWALWGIHIAGAIYAAQLQPCRFPDCASGQQTAPLSLPQVLSSAISVMAGVCGWLLLFRVVIAFLDRWILWLFPIPVQVLVCGMLELTNGCMLLPQIPDVQTRFVLCSGLLAMGGLCVTLQTLSAAKGLSLKYYLLGKLHQTMFSLCASAALICKNGLFLLPVGAVLIYAIVWREKTVAIPSAMMYNGRK